MTQPPSELTCRAIDELDDWKYVDREKSLQNMIYDFRHDREAAEYLKGAAARERVRVDAARKQIEAKWPEMEDYRTDHLKDLPEDLRARLGEGEQAELLNLLDAYFIYKDLSPQTLMGKFEGRPSRTERTIKLGYVKFEGRRSKKRMDELMKKYPGLASRHVPLEYPLHQQIQYAIREDQEIQYEIQYGATLDAAQSRQDRWKSYGIVSETYRNKINAEATQQALELVERNQRPTLTMIEGIDSAHDLNLGGEYTIMNTGVEWSDFNSIGF